MVFMVFSPISKFVKNNVQISSSIPVLVPLTQVNKDPQNNQLQLWKSKKYGMIGAVIDESGTISFVPKNKIWSPLCPGICPDELMHRIQSVSFRRWSLVFKSDSKEIVVLPELNAAAFGNKAEPSKKTKGYTHNPKFAGQSHFIFASKKSSRSENYYVQKIFFNAKGECLGRIDYTPYSASRSRL